MKTDLASTQSYPQTVSQPQAHLEPTRGFVLAAFAAVYIIWGSTYLAIHVAVETLPPFLMAGCRFALAGSVLYAWLRFRGVPRPDFSRWRIGMIAGTLLLVGGNGLVVWAEQTVPSGLTALMIAVTPIWFALLDWLRPGGARPRLRTIAGIFIGFCGVILLVTGRAAGVHGQSVSLPGIAALVVAGISWASGSLYTRAKGRSESPWMNAAVQMICGGAGSLVLGASLGELGHRAPGGISMRSVFSFAYLVAFGSWIGFSAYVWLLKVSTPARVSTYAYVNPVIAVFLGWAVLGETVNQRTGWAALVIVLGVIIITVPVPQKAR